MPAYWVARSKINDPVEYKKYTDLVPAIIEKFGGKVLARGGRFQIMEGPDKFHRFIVIEFPTLEGAEAWMETEVRPPHGAYSSKQFLLARRWSPDYFASWVPRTTP